jgi:dihydrofolate reductase
MNRTDKLVASRSLTDVSAWPNSALLQGDVADPDRDVIVVGSATLAQELMARGVVDEYRLLVFPLVTGAGRRLFEQGSLDLELVSAAGAGATALLTYRRATASR